MSVDAKIIDQLLPQTQCGDCGFAGCMPYAEALVNGSAPIDRCRPGGAATLQALGIALNIDPGPYFADVQARMSMPAVAVIRESECIGCTKCIAACPVDAIIGSNKTMHSVLSDECTGCGLCIDPCPVDCIEMQYVETLTYAQDHARKRYQAKQTRLLQQQYAKQQLYLQKKQLVQNNKVCIE